jgi:hypothetical protein
LEEIWILLAFSVAKGLKLYQIDVKSAFWNDVLEEVCEATSGLWECEVPPLSV